MSLAAVNALQDTETYRIGSIERRGLPLVIELKKDGDVTRLCQWIHTRERDIHELMTRHGAILVRGFDVDGPGDFERIARAIDDDLKKEYLGTSPRNVLTNYVFSASELPDFYPIPQHCEMTCG